MKTIARSVMLMLLCLLVALNGGEGLLTSKSCVTFNHEYELNVTAFMGRWYEVQRLYDPLDPEQENCVVLNYQLRENGTFEIRKSFQITKEGHPTYVSGTAKLRVVDGSGLPQFYESLNAAVPGTLINILTTDLENYAILYSCASINSTHNREASWVLSRFPVMPPDQGFLVNLTLNGYLNRSSDDWPVTVQSPDFCKPSDPTKWEQPKPTEPNQEFLATEASGKATDDYEEPSHQRGSQPKITSTILFWIGLLAGGMLLLLGVWIIVARSKKSTDPQVQKKRVQKNQSV
uniref:Putative apolipoprotein d/lipocalin n=1 Tax=Anopheles marajoara TaxID=58244 RepID=A0A2M4BVY2_9DIPT